MENGRDIWNVEFDESEVALQEIKIWLKVTKASVNIVLHGYYFGY